MKEVADFYNIVTNKLIDWYTNIVEHIPNLILAILIFICFIIVSKIFAKIITKYMVRANLSKTLINLITTISAFCIYTLGFFIALEVLDLGKAVTSLLAGIGVIGLALGFAFQEIASNLISGVILAFNSPVNEGDMIEAHGYIGTVKYIGLRSMTIISPQGQNIQVPNRLIFQNPFTNYTIEKYRRIDLSCGISYGDDLEKVEKIVLETVNNIDGILKEAPRKPFFFFEKYGDSSIQFQVYMWLDQPYQAHYLAVRSLAIKALKKAFDENGITIPFPIRTLDFGIKGGKQLGEILPKP